MKSLAGIRRLAPAVFLVATLLSLVSCGGDSSPTPVVIGTSVSFAVFSDPHLYDAATLGSGGQAFEEYLAQDHKLLVESEEILDTVIADLKAKKPAFVIIPGDMSKDGELINHQKMAAKLADLESAGIPVYVVPGNHDINNPMSVRYSGSQTIPVPTVSPARFRDIYGPFGFHEAIATDSDSLSYIAEPTPGVWLFAIDSCRYAENGSVRPIDGGALKASTRAWIQARLAEAKDRGKVCIGMLHHAVTEHFTGQAVQFPDYVIADYEEISKEFADNGMKYVFTGHFHAHDVTLKKVDGGATLYDVETGSLVTYPVPYRSATLNLTTRKMSVTSSRVDSIPSHPSDFREYALNFQKTGISTIALYQLTHPPFSLDQASAEAVAPLMVNAFMAHYNGDERLTDPATIRAIRELVQSPDEIRKTLGFFLYSLWTDLSPADNSLHFLTF